MAAVIFTRKNAAQIVDEITGEVGKAVIKEVSCTIEKSLRETLLMFSVAPVIDPSRIIFRASTIQTLLDTIRQKVGNSENYTYMLRAAGEKCGVDFGHILVNTLKQKNKYPADHEALLETWALFDSSARWGKIVILTYNENAKLLRIGIKDNFLTQDYEREKHRHCAFLEGYIKGVIDQTFLEWSRWYKLGRAKPGYLCSERITEEPSDDKCIFVINLKEEELIESRNLLVEALEKFDINQYSDVVVNARSALEFALKEKIGVKITDRFSFFRGLKAYERIGVLLPFYDTAFRQYDTTSAVVHKTRKASREEAYTTIVFVRDFIFELERIQLTNEQKADLKELSAPP